jgi:hypothetical protein
MELLRHQDRLRGFIRCLLIDRRDADDVWQDVNLVLVRKAADFRPGGSHGRFPRRLVEGQALRFFSQADANSPSYYANRHVEASFSEQLKAENPRLMTLLMTHHAPTKADRLVIGRSVADYSMKPVEAGGYEGRFVANPDGRGYTLEYAIPWKTLGIADDPPRRGDTLAVLWELHLSDATGRLWRGQIIEIRNLGEPQGVFPYERAAA